MTEAERSAYLRGAREMQEKAAAVARAFLGWELTAKAIAALSLPASDGWRTDMENAPRDEIIWVWCPGVEDLEPMVSLCQWHQDAGFCVDELRTPTHWQTLAEPSPPTGKGE